MVKSGQTRFPRKPTRYDITYYGLSRRRCLSVAPCLAINRNSPNQKLIVVMIVGGTVFPTTRLSLGDAGRVR